MTGPAIRRPSVRYQHVLDCVRTEPERAPVIYRRWAELPEWKSLTRRHRNELRWVARALENLAGDGYVVREIERGRGITFRLPTDELPSAG